MNVAALLALLVSVAYTLVAVRNPQFAVPIAVPVAVVAISLMAVQARHGRRGHDD